MVGKDYLLEKPPGPTAPVRFVHQQVMPVMIDIAGAGEVALQRLSNRLAVKPAAILGGLAGAGAIFILAALRRRQRMRQARR